MGSPRGGAHHQQQNPIHNPTKSENRVHFDLNNHSNNSGVASSDIRKPARSTPRTNTSSRPNNIHLPSDARQRLEQLVSYYLYYYFSFTEFFFVKLCSVHNFFTFFSRQLLPVLL